VLTFQNKFARGKSPESQVTCYLASNAQKYIDKFSLGCTEFNGGQSQISGLAIVTERGVLRLSGDH